MVRKWPAKPKADRAARVRENQRRHRARTKSYIAELENEVAGMRSRLSEVLERNESLVAELEQLRGQSKGGSPTAVANDRDAAAPSSPVPAARQTPLPRTQAAPISSGVKRLRSSSPVPRDVTHPESRDAVPAASWRRGLSARLAQSSSISEVNEDPKTMPPSTHDGEPCACHRIADDVFVCPPAVASLDTLDTSTLRTCCSHLAPPRPGESTIPCSTAYGIINHQNYRGHDLTTITRLLQPGFRGAVLEGDDCRVMSSLVFAVLDTISST